MICHMDTLLSDGCVPNSPLPGTNCHNSWLDNKWNLPCTRISITWGPVLPIPNNVNTTLYISTWKMWTWIEKIVKVRVVLLSGTYRMFKVPLKNRGTFDPQCQTHKDMICPAYCETHDSGMNDPWDISSMGRFIQGRISKGTYRSRNVSSKRCIVQG